MKFKIFLFLFFFALFIIDNSSAKFSFPKFGKFGGKIGGRAPSSSRISHASSGRVTSHGTSSRGSSHGTSHGTSHGDISHGTSHITRTPVKSSGDFLKAEGGGATRPVAPPSTTNQGRLPGVVTDSRQTSPYQPSAPQDHIMKSSVTSLQNQDNKPGHTNPSWGNPYLNNNKPSIPGQPHTPLSNSYPDINKPPAPVPQAPPIGLKDHVYPPPIQPGHPPYPTGNSPYPGGYSPNPSWGNPYLNNNKPSIPGQPHTPSSNSYPNINKPPAPVPQPPPIGFKDHVYPPPIQSGHTPYPTGNSPYPGRYPSYPSGNAPYPSGSYRPTGGYPHAHIPHSPWGNSSGTSFSSLGNPYSMHPPGQSFNSPGPSYYPQQTHVFAQPAAQPFVPGQTVIMMPGQQDSGRGFGQMVKEALVFSTINAGVNRLINPHTHYIESKPAETAPSTTTHITYNNQYFNTEPGTMNSTNVPLANVPRSNPTLSGTSAPAEGPNSGPVLGTGNTYVLNISGSTNPTSAGVPNSAGTNTGVIGATSGVNGNLSAATRSNASNDQNSSSGYPSTVDNTVFNRISDKELFQITEELFAKSSFNVSKYLKLNLQKRVTSPNVTDEAKEPLFDVDSQLFDYPTIHVTRSLYDSYEHDFRKKINRTVELRKMEDLLIDTFLHTNVMSTAMNWLADRGFIDPDDFERKDVLRRIWFTMFSGSTCGFERVFASENYETAIIGVQDWIYFENQESLNRIDYMGYVDKLDLGNSSSSLVKLNFQMNGIIRPNATIFVGTLPELEMALYTICFYARSNSLCPVMLGKTQFNIYTHSFIYFGNEVIDLGLPMF
nr:PREDICTED: poly(U)-specific endoribonuclease homolog [Megachile rotundata]XP_012149083.1 PREDICTED: poly(U)-specific endoribonuclease homolog [Megachile rotundata]XP_012149084.1 PREDICTED: poly(U)-specific endoribonuclease homolog [Megachile rotundata]XP_012149085.1 PREDICTED: poly(U)-specific endoribonuclease homolog [Megachile rotundata]XP_012149087.1 PREDICTED: poly(U)-specific endoribonuclease homolog [Megachile rotundata]XP_012149088.1 PREDICTED: poly(U)-specific endoribonuclease homol